MDIQSVTANSLPAAVVQPAGKAPAQPEVKAESSKTRGPENAPQARPDSQKARPDSQKIREEDVRDAVANIEQFVAQSARDITFSIDKEAGFIVKVIDRTSHDVIRQIPSEEVVAIARALDKLQGLFVRDKI
jgi:flagellar protein FlaG